MAHQNSFAGGRWKASDGLTYHKMMADCAEERYQHAESEIDAETEYEIRTRSADGTKERTGRIDLLIDRRYVIDFKTHQMDAWRVERARSLGRASGRKLRRYIDSPDIAQNAEGHLLMVGVRSQNPAVEAAFKEGAAEYGISTSFLEKAEPDAVLDHVESKILKRTQEQRDREAITSNDASPSMSGAAHAQEYRLTIERDRKEEAANLLESFRQRQAVTFTEVRHEAPHISVPSEQEQRLGASDWLSMAALVGAVVQRARQIRQQRQADAALQSQRTEQNQPAIDEGVRERAHADRSHERSEEKVASPAERRSDRPAKHKSERRSDRDNDVSM